ncbi:ribonuclease H-like domain-containing protein [Tanacetum coccineum]
MSGTQGENPPPPPPQETQQTPTQQTPHTVSTIKLPILKKGEYDIWAMKIEHYLAHTDYPIWEVIQNGNGPVSVTTDTTGQIKILPPKTGEEIVARERERKARTTLLMAIPEDHLAKFHKMTDAKDMWNAIKSRFGGNDESKKMQKYILKQQFEGFTLEIHGAGVSTEDANQKFLRSLPSAWLQVSLIMRNKPGMDSLSFDDLYNNLRVFENDVKGSTASTSNLQNIAFVSENTSSTNDVSTAYGVSNTSGHNSKHEQTSSYSLLASQSSTPQLDHEDLDQVDEYDLEEMDLKWQVAMISMRIKKFYKKTGRKLQFDAKEPVGFDKTKVECYNCHKTGHFARECRTKEDNRRRDGWNTGNKDGWNAGNKDGSRTGKKEESRALVTVDGECVDWTTHSEDDENYAFMASNSSGSNTQVTSCSCECKESYANLKRLYDVQREELSDASIEIKAYTQALKKVEAQLVAHQQEKTQPSEPESQINELDACDSNISTEPSELVFEPVVNESHIEVQPKEVDNIFGRNSLLSNAKSNNCGPLQQQRAEIFAVASCVASIKDSKSMLDYCSTSWNTKIYIDNESTIMHCENLSNHSRDIAYAIRHQLIRDAMKENSYKDGVVHPTKRRVYVMFDNKEDTYQWSDVCQLEEMLVKALRRFRESLRRVTDGAEAFLILTLFILCLDKVSTDHAKLVPLSKVTQTYKKPFQSHTCSSNLSNYHSSLQALISRTDDLSLLSKMAALESYPKHNMIAYLEKTEGNVEFHEVIDFLRRSYIFHALTVSPVVSTTFVEQFWTSAKSKTINNVRHITAKVAGKVVSISEASIRTDLIFDDADGIDSLPNQAIFNAIQRMGYEGDLSVLTFNKDYLHAQ